MGSTKKPAGITVESVKLADLQPFPGNPYKVTENDELRAMAESIRDHGVITPLVVRPIGSGYEVVSGHRRMAAAAMAGVETVPAFVREMSDTAAIIALVDSNMHRENILPSEKAFAYKMKLDAIKKQGQRNDLSGDTTCGRPVHKSRDEIAGPESGRQVQRYVRLTELNPQLLQMVDDGRIALAPAVELSYLEPQAQAVMLEAMQLEDRTPNLSQAQRMRQLLADCKLDRDVIFEIMEEEKPNQKEQVKLKADSIRKYFPKGYTTQQMEQVIMKLLADWQLKRDKAARNQDAR